MNQFCGNNKVWLFFFCGLLYLSEITLSSANDKGSPVLESDDVLQGVIKEISPANSVAGAKGLSGTFLFHEHAGGQQRNIVIHVLDKTRIFVDQGTGAVLATFSSLRVGDKVEVTISSGRLMLSYPLQAMAIEVRIIKSGGP